MNTSSTSIFISWLPPPEQDQNGVITGYNVTYSIIGGGVMVNTTSGIQRSIELTGLEKFTQYSISVAAFTSVGIGPSDSITVSTDTDGK